MEVHENPLFHCLIFGSRHWNQFFIIWTQSVYSVNFETSYKEPTFMKHFKTGDEKKDVGNMT